MEARDDPAWVCAVAAERYGGGLSEVSATAADARAIRSIFQNSSILMCWLIPYRQPKRVSGAAAK
jgi:hypothetical protein